MTGTEEGLESLIHPGAYIVLLGNGYIYALPIRTSLVWGTAPVLAIEFLGSSFLPIHQPSGPEWAPTSRCIFERTQQSMLVRHCLPPQPPMG